MRRLYIFALFAAFALSAADARAVGHRKDEITIALLTDLHVTPGNSCDSKTDEAIAEINRAKYDLVIIDGDMTNMGSNEELHNIYGKLRRLRHRTLTTVGNHETTWSESGCTEFQRLWGHDGSTTAKVGDYLFVAYPAGPYMKMAEGGIPTQTLAWIDSQMAKAGKRRIVSVCHYPLNNDITNRVQLREVLAKYDVAASLCGHYHKPRLMNFDSIPGILCRSLSLGKGADEHFGYTILRFANDSIYVSEKRIGEKPVLQYAVRQGKSDEIAALPCDAEPAATNAETMGAELVVEDSGSIYTNVAVRDNIIYYGNSEGKVKAYDYADKRVVWERRFRNPIYSSPILHEDKLIVATLSDGLCALDSKDGRVVWRNRDCNGMVGDGVIANDALYIGMDGTMLRIDPQTGKTVWRFDFGKGQPQGRPTVEGKYLVFGAWDCHLYCVDTESGREVWRWDNGNANRLFSPGHIVPRIAGGRVMIVAPDRHVTFIDLASGRQLWRVKQRRVRETTGLSDDGKTFYAKTMDGEMIAVPTDADAYTERWCADAGWGYDHNFCPIAVCNGRAYMANRYGMVAEISKEDGTVLRTAKLGNSSANDFAVDADGNVWTTLIEGKIYKIKPIHNSLQ